MSGSTLTSFIAWAPTLLFVLIVLLSTLRGLIRGFRKSTILFIHYIIAIVVGTICYFVVIKMAYEQNVSSIMGNISIFQDSIYEDCKTLAEYGAVFASTKIEMVDSTIQSNQYFIALANSFASLAINIVAAVACFLIIPILVRILLRILYVFIYSEAKHKRHVRETGEVYKRHGLLGMLIGALRGVVTASFVWGYVFFIFAFAGGKITATSTSEHIKVSETEGSNSFDELSKIIGYDITPITDGLAKMSNTGLMSAFDKVNVGTTNVFYYFADSVLTIKTPYIEEDEIKYKDVKLREVLTDFMTACYIVGDSSLIKATESGVSINTEVLSSEYITKLTEALKVERFADTLTVFLAMAGTAIKDGQIKVDDSIKQYFTDEAIESILKIDLKSDITKLESICADLVKLVEDAGLVTESGFNINDIDYTKFPVASVKSICTKLSDVKILTDALLPVGSAFALSSLKPTLENQGFDLNGVDFANANWKTEVANLGNVYEKFSALGLTQEEIKSFNSDLVMAKLGNEEFVTKAKALVNTIFTSDLISDVSIVVVKYGVSKINSTTDTEALIDKLKTNLNTYTATDLKADIGVLLDSCAPLIALYSDFKNVDTSSTSSLLGLLSNVDVPALKETLLGTDDGSGNYSGGVYDLKLLNNAIPDAIEYGLTKLGNFFSQEDINSVTDGVTDVSQAWRSELANVFDVIEVIAEVDFSQFDQNDLNTIPTFTDAQVNALSGAVSKSKLMKNTLVNTLYPTISSISTNVKDKDAYEWFDTDTTYGEINKLFKALMTLKEHDALAAVTSGDNTQIMTALADLADDPEDVDRITDSAVLMDVCEDLLVQALESASGDTIDKTSIVWANEYETVDGVKKIKKYGELNCILRALQAFVNHDGLDVLNGGDTSAMVNLFGDMANNPSEIDSITDSYLLLTVVKKVIVDQISTTLNATIDSSTIVWANEYETVDGVKKIKNYGELNSIARILTINALKNSEGNIDFNNLSDISVFKNLTTTDVDKITNSSIVNSCLTSFMSSMLPSSFSIPDDINWANIYTGTTLTTKGELQVLVEVLNLDCIEVTSSSINVDKLSNVDTLANEDEFSNDDINVLSQSAIIMSGINSTVGDTISSLLDPVPTGIKWGNKVVGGVVTEIGELQRLVTALRQARTALGNDTTGNKIALTTDNVVTGVLKMSSHASLVDSVIVYEILSKQVIENATDSSVLYVPASAKDSYGKIEKSELVLMLDAISLSGITDITNISIESLDISNEDFRNALARSVILTRTVVKNILSQSSITVPTDLNNIEAAGWYATLTSSYKNSLTDAEKALIDASELDKLFVSIDALELDLNDLSASADLNKIKTFNTATIDRITNSRVVCKVLDTAVGDNLPSSFTVPSDLVWANTYTGSTLTTVGELQALVDILNLDCISVDASGQIDTSKISSISFLADNTKLSDDDINTLSESRIVVSGINSNVTSSVGDLVSSLPSDIVWANTLSGRTRTAKGELQHFVEALRSIQTALGSTTLSTDNVVTGILTMNSHASLFDSVVLYEVSSKKILDVSSEADSIIVVPDSAKAGSKVKKSEVVYLFDAVSLAGITDLSNVSLTGFNTAIGDEDFRNALSRSEILSRTVVSKIVTQTSITIPTELSSVNSSSWYATLTSDYTDSLTASELALIDATELDKLFVAIKELNLDLNDLGFNSSILSGMNSSSTYDSTRTKLNVLYNSLVIKATISSKVADQITIPASYKKNSTTTINVKDSEGYILESELANLFDAFDVLGISMSDSSISISTATITTKLCGNDTAIDTVLSSGIVSNEFSTQLSTVTSIVVPQSSLFTVSSSNYIYIDDMAGLLKGMDELGVTGDIGSTNFANIANVNLTNLGDALTNSKILTATISSQLIDSDIVTMTYYENDVTSKTVVTLDGTTKMIGVDQIVWALKSIKATGVNDVTATDSITLSTIKGITNYEELIEKSFILDKIISDLMVDELSTINALLAFASKPTISSLNVVNAKTNTNVSTLSAESIKVAIAYAA